MCSGKTHLVCSAATIATPVVLFGTQPLLTGDTRQIWLGMGLVVVGVVGGLFPDLDSPESELLHAPHKLARAAGWVTVSALGLPQLSIAGLLVNGLVRLPGIVAGGLITGLSLAIRSVSHHRGLTHELRGMALFTILVLLVTLGLTTLWQLPPTAVLRTTALTGAAWMLGYLSHLILDAATISGIPLFSRRRMFHLLPRGWRIRTGTWPDVLLLRGIAITWLTLLLALLITS